MSELSDRTTRPAGAAIDHLRPFQVERVDIRGRLVRLGPTCHEVLSRHGYPPAVSRLLAEALALASLLAGALKFEGVFTLQAKGDGPVRMLLADVQSPGRLRGYVQFDKKAGDVLHDPAASVPRLFGAGHIAFTVDQGVERDRYQGIVALEGETLSDCAHQYFRESEQIDSAIRLAAGQGPDGRWRAAGLMIQRLPEGDPALIARGREYAPDEWEDDWRRAVMLLATARDQELLDFGLDADALLYRLYHEDGVRVFPAQALRFGCRCSRRRGERVLASLSREQLVDLVVDGKFEVTCEFCNTVYIYPAETFLDTARS